jgi:hypothetical protein
LGLLTSRRRTKNPAIRRVLYSEMSDAQADNDFTRWARRDTLREAVFL